MVRLIAFEQVAQELDSKWFNHYLKRKQSDLIWQCELVSNLLEQLANQCINSISGWRNGRQLEQNKPSI